MEMQAYPRTIREIFTGSVKYVVPRFQREYSWKKEQINTLWNDVCDNINFQNGEYLPSEYFIGSIVLVGANHDFEKLIVDGQQRLTTITILLSAIFHALKSIGQEEYAISEFENYIEGKSEGKKYYKLDNETPKPFFQKSIQHIDREDEPAVTEEEKRLEDAYLEFRKLLTKDALISRLLDLDREGDNFSDEDYKNALIAVKKFVTDFLKVIYISVKDEDDAYVIFETLNARGIELSSVDLVKNIIFKRNKKSHPNDDTKSKWRKMRDKLSERESKVNIDTFFRHFWLSNYSFVQEKHIYREFKSLVYDSKLDTNVFLNRVCQSSTKYTIINAPLADDFKELDKKPIYYSLKAFNTFGVTQVRTFILCLWDLYDSKKIKQKDLVKYLGITETFHFHFTAVTSSRASGLESKYSKWSRDLRQINTRDQIILYLEKNVVTFFKEKKPIYQEFEKGMKRINYVKNKTLIQYIFSRCEMFLKGSVEFVPFDMTLEHICNQKDQEYSHRNLIGNMLPLATLLNGQAKTKALSEKKQFYEESTFELVKEFLLENKDVDRWDDEKILKRTEDIAKFCYEKVWLL